MKTSSLTGDIKLSTLSNLTPSRTLLAFGDVRRLIAADRVVFGVCVIAGGAEGGGAGCSSASSLSLLLVSSSSPLDDELNQKNKY